LEDRQRARFGAEELAIVLSRYDLGSIESITEFARGSRKSPKVGIVCQRGKYLLKRRPPSRAFSTRMASAHRLQAHLAVSGFPLPRLIPPSSEDGAVLHWGGQIYEMFDYVRGQSYSGTVEETRSAALTLARFHNATAGFPAPEALPTGDYHDSNPVRTALNAIPSTLSGHDSIAGIEGEVIDLSQRLYDAYESAAATVQRRGLRTWPAGVIHGDWHPGNMLFRNLEVVAVIDYDSIRFSQRVIDLANGALQFALERAAAPEDWPDELDQPRVTEFLTSYRRELPISADERACLPYLMVEVLVGESVLPIAVTGSFGRYQGFRFLKMVGRKVAWLLANAERLGRSLLPEG